MTARTTAGRDCAVVAAVLRWFYWSRQATCCLDTPACFLTLLTNHTKSTIFAFFNVFKIINFPAIQNYSGGDFSSGRREKESRSIRILSRLCDAKMADDWHTKGVDFRSVQRLAPLLFPPHFLFVCVCRPPLFVLVEISQWPIIEIGFPNSTEKRDKTSGGVATDIEKRSEICRKRGRLLKNDTENHPLFSGGGIRNWET